MSILSWFSPKRKPDPALSVMPSSGLSRMDSTKPFSAARNNASAQPANRKHERMARREVLYAVVREAMVRAGVLSSSYKFKVLSLDARGSQFLVMVDLAQGSSSDTNRLAEIEAMVAQSAKARHDIVVTAVYWRANEHVAIGDPAQRAGGRPLVSQPAPLAVEPAAARPAPVRTAAAKPRSEPVQADEVAAFRKALNAGMRGEPALAVAKPPEQAQPQPQPHAQPAAPAAGAHGYTLLTGFEDTEMVEGQDNVADHLSGTQFGALR